MRILFASLLLSSSVLAADPHATAPDPHAAADPHAAPAPAPAAAAAAAAAPAPQDALKMLTEGNKRFTAGESKHANANQDRRCLTSSGGQHPYATILSCADSRVPPELIFDAGIGELFVIRVAGNVSDVDEIATTEYGACHLNTPVIVVMGHTKCGAVTAVVEKAPLHGNLAKLVDNIEPAAESVRKDHPELSGNSLVARTIRQNVYQSMADLITHSPDVATRLKEKKVTLVGALYDIHTGEVEFLGTHPDEASLLQSAPAVTEHAKDSHAEKGTHQAAPHDAHGSESAKEPAHAPSWRDRIRNDQHGAADAHPATDAHSATDAHAATEAKVEPSLVKKYGPLGAFVIGALALSAVVLHLVRK